MTPESVKEKEYILNYLEKIFFSFDWWRRFRKEIEDAILIHEDDNLIVSNLGIHAEVMKDRYGKTINRGMVGTIYKQIVFTE